MTHEHFKGARPDENLALNVAPALGPSASRLATSTGMRSEARMNAHHHGDMPSLAASELAHHDVVDLPPLGAAAGRARVTPTSDNAHLAVGEVEEQWATDRPIFHQPADACKRFATLRAELAILGNFTLLELADGSYLVTRWNCCRPLVDLRAVAAFVRQVGRAA